MTGGSFYYVKDLVEKYGYVRLHCALLANIHDIFTSRKSNMNTLYIYKVKKSYVLNAHSFFIYIFRVMILVVQLPMLVVRAETSLAHLHHVIEFRPQDR